MTPCNLHSVHISLKCMTHLTGTGARALWGQREQALGMQEEADEMGVPLPSGWVRVPRSAKL